MTNIGYEPILPPHQAYMAYSQTIRSTRCPVTMPQTTVRDTGQAKLPLRPVSRPGAAAPLLVDRIVANYTQHFTWDDFAVPAVD